MRRYGKVSTAFWVDEKVRTFTDDGRLAFLAVLTHPTMTSVGAMRATMAGLAAELGWSPRRLARALAPALEQRMIELNQAAAYLALRNFVRYNRPENPNVCRAWVTAIASLPECPERLLLIERCRRHLAENERPTFAKAFDEVFAEVFGEASGQPFAQPLAKPEPEQEQEQEQEQEVSPLPPFAQPVASNDGRRTARTVKLEPIP